MLSFGFPPVSSSAAHILILGSLPGRPSLERGEYYANPQNAFWRIVAARISELPPDYAGRVAALIRYRIALWDVLAAASRSGSLDAAIADDAIPNNFRAFFHAHPHIRIVGFNGATAARLYERHVVQTLPQDQRAIARVTLPSTSPAHARLPFAVKASRWSILWDDVAVSPGAASLLTVRSSACICLEVRSSDTTPTTTTALSPPISGTKQCHCGDPHRAPTTLA